MVTPQFKTALTLLMVAIIWQPAIGQEEARNWHQWRGPSATGEVTIGNPPTEWSEDENIKWKVTIPGEGSSTPIIWKDQVFLVSAVITDRKPDAPIEIDQRSRTIPPANIVEFRVLSIDRKTGKVRWNQKVTEAVPHEGRHKSTTYAAASPVTDGKHLYVSFGSYGVFCLTLDGKTVWSRDLGDMRTRRGWGEAVSPALSDNRLVIMWDQEDQSRIFVLDSESGKTVWEKERDEPTTWATPLLVSRGDETQIITAGTNQIRSYRLSDGELSWVSGGLTLNAIPCPVLHDDHVICMSGYRGNAAVSIDLNSVPSARNPTVKWKVDRDTPYVPSPLVTQGRLYFTKGLSNVLSCLDVKTGKAVYSPRRLTGLKNLYASPVATDKHIYFVSREGATLVIKNSENYEEVSVNQLDGAIDASPAIVGDQIFLRSKSHLYCIAK